MSSRRSFLKLVGAVGGGALIAACSGAPTAPTAAPAKSAESTKPAASGAAPAGTTAPAGGSTPAAAAPAGGGAASQLRLNIRSGAYNDTWVKVGDVFKQKFPNVELKFEPFPSSELTQKLETMAAGNTIGDLYFMNTFMMDHQRFGALGIAKPLDDYAKKDNIDWSQWFKTAVDQLYANGKLYGMLDGASPGRAGLYYSIEMFQEAGIPEPDDSWTLDKLADVGQKLAKDGKFGFRPLLSSSIAPEILVWVRAFGGDIYSKDGKKATINTPEAKKAIQYIADGMNKTKWMPKPDQGNDASTLFAARKLAMHNSGTWEANAANQTKVKWNLAPMAKGPAARGSMAEANTICVTSASKNPDMAWEFAKVDASKDGGVFHLDLGVTPGGRPDVYGDPKVQEKYFWMKVWNRIWEEALPFNGPANYRGSEASDTMKQGLDPIWLGQSTPDQVLDKLNDQVQKILDKPA